MSKTAYTPGPWQVSARNRTSIGRMDADHSPGFRTVAVVREGNGQDETDANAALVSAAPELLAALEQIVTDWHGIPERHRDAARAAIAKAHGGS